MVASKRSTRSDIMPSDLLERLAELEHQQWIYYSKDVSRQITHANSLEQLHQQIKRKWSPNWIEYSMLAERDKEKDRVWARKALKLIKKSLRK